MNSLKLATVSTLSELLIFRVAQNPKLQEAAQTGNFARYAMPRAVFLTLQPCTIENTFMTPTLKIKRNNLMAHYAADIDGMYRPAKRNGAASA